MEDLGAISLIPTLCVFVLAVATRRPIESLIAGSIVGLVIIHGTGFIGGFAETSVRVMTDYDVAWVIPRLRIHGRAHRRADPHRLDTGVHPGHGQARPVGHRCAAGDLTVRIVGAYAPAGPEDVDRAVHETRAWKERIKGERYHYRVLKIMDDGTVEGRTAAMFEDYQGEPGNSGKTAYTQEQMTEMVVGAAAEQIDAHIHALGERAVHEALNSIEAARNMHPDSTSRYTIYHIEVITDGDLPRFAELDVIAQSTPLWASYDTYGEQFVSADQFSRFWRFNSLDELGVKLTWGSDFPASGAGMAGMSPILQMEIGHTRQAAGEPDAPVQPRESERIDIEAAIRGYTIDAAYQLHMEDEIGSLEAGKKADLVVLDKNLFESDPYEIHRTKVFMTLVDGEIVYASMD